MAQKISKAYLLICLVFLLGSPQAHSQVYEFFKPWAEQGDPMAQSVIGDLYRNGAEGLAQNYEQALTWYRRAADQGYLPAVFYLGYMQLKGLGITKDAAKGLELMLQAARGGLNSSLYALGTIYEEGVDVPKNLESAFHWYREAARGGGLMSQLKVAFLYEKGEGVSASLHQAYKWLLLADMEFKGVRGQARNELEAGKVRIGSRLSAQEIEAVQKAAQDCHKNLPSCN